MQKIYLDTNLLIDMFDSRDCELSELVDAVVSRETFEFPFTKTQIDEITGAELDQRSIDRLGWLSRISNNKYRYSAPNVLVWKVEDPISVWQTINEVPDSGMLFDLARLIPHEKLVEMRDELGLDPSVLNNLSGRDAVKEIDAALTRIKLEKYPEALGTLNEMMEYFELTAPGRLKGVYDAAGQIDRSFKLGDRVMMAFSLLQTYGYWPDTKGVYEKGSGMEDSQHVTSAVDYDYLASRDKGMRNRAEASYSILGAMTKTLDIHGLKALLRET